MAGFISFYSIYHLKKNKNLPKVAKLSTLNLMFFFLTFAYLHGSAHYALLWTVFFPIFAIFSNGKKVGLYFSIIFYLLLYTIAYLSIGEWDQGNWITDDWMRLIFTSLLLTFGLYMNESSQEESDKKLTQIRENEKKYINELHKKSISDELTSLYNRRYYNETTPKLISLAKRQNLFVTFFILDIDYFKNYNDRYGHIQGDKALIEVANAIKNYIQRNDDFVFRLGGEEFAGIILSNNPENTLLRVNEICKIVENLKIEHSDSQVSKFLTVSVGMATISNQNDYSIDKLYKLADEALYSAKNGGRNRAQINPNTF
jgi:diguanylate cyclase (GGDEF)-like protein